MKVIYVNVCGAGSLCPMWGCLVMFFSVCVKCRIGVLLWLRLLGLFMRMVF